MRDQRFTAIGGELHRLSAIVNELSAELEWWRAYAAYVKSNHTEVDYKAGKRAAKARLVTSHFTEIDRLPKEWALEDDYQGTYSI